MQTNYLLFCNIIGCHNKIIAGIFEYRNAQCNDFLSSGLTLRSMFSSQLFSMDDVIEYFLSNPNFLNILAPHTWSLCLNV